MFRKLFLILLIIILAPVTLWAFGAICYDAPYPRIANIAIALLWLVAMFFAIKRLQRARSRLGAWLCLFLAVLVPWLMKKPSDSRDWAPEFARTPSATIQGDVVTFTNFRNFDYRSDGTPIERWETRSFHMSKLKNMDFFMTYWGGGTLVGHPMFSFDFGDEGHVVFSIESRREKGEEYGLISSLYRQFEVAYLVGSESDIVRLRTNVRKDETVYLYRLKIRETTTKLRFTEYLDSLNRFHQKPAWYNVITANCTTCLRAQFTTAERNTLDWRIIINGKFDELISERGIFEGSLTFPELKRRSLINSAARAHPDPRTYSDVIREGRPGF